MGCYSPIYMPYIEEHMNMMIINQQTNEFKAKRQLLWLLELLATLQQRMKKLACVSGELRKGLVFLF